MSFFKDKTQLKDAFDFIKNEYGENVIYSQEKLRTLLLDLAPGYQKQIRIFLNVTYNTEIVKLAHTNSNISVELIIKRIMDEVGLSELWASEAAVMLLGFFGRDIEFNSVAEKTTDELISSTTDVDSMNFETIITEVHTNSTVEPLLKRAFMFLADGDFNNAEQYCEKVLDLDPECVKAYLGKFMAENFICSEAEIASLPRNYDTSSVNLRKALAFATREENLRLNGAIAKAKKLYEQTYIHLKLPQKTFKEISLRLSCGERHSSILLLDGRIIGTGGKNNHKLYNFSDVNNAATLTDEFNSRDNPFVNFFTYSTISGNAMEIRENGWNDGKVQCFTPLSYKWSNIKKVACQYHHSVGLKSDGTVVASGDNCDNSCNVSDWTDIVDIACGDNHTVGLKSDGTVVACGAKKYYDNDHWYEVECDYGQCQVDDWKDISIICCNNQSTIGVKTDGTVCVAGAILKDRFHDAVCAGWTDIIGISASHSHVVGVKSNGTVVACGSNDNGQCNVSSWRNIVAVACGSYHTIGIRNDGAILSTGRSDDNQCDIKDYRFFFDKNAEKQYYDALFEKRRSAHRCQYCGGTFKGFFSSRCTYCGKEKDY